MRINTGGWALNQLKQADRKKGGLKRLASGFRINSAADDASGLAVSEKMRAQITGLKAAQGNVRDAVSLVQTADGALEEIHSILQRLNELSVQAANGIYTVEERITMQNEMDQMLDDIDRIAAGTQFNGFPLLDGSCAGGPAINTPATTASFSGEIDLSKAQDGSTFELDGVVFEFDKDGRVRDPAAVIVDISGADRAQAFRDALEASSLNDDYEFAFDALAGSRIQLKVNAKGGGTEGQKVEPKVQTIPELRHGDTDIIVRPNITKIVISDIECHDIVYGSTLTINDTVFEFSEDGSVSTPGAIPMTCILPYDSTIDATVQFYDAINGAINSSPLADPSNKRYMDISITSSGIGSITVSDRTIPPLIESVVLNKPGTLSNTMEPSNV